MAVLRAVGAGETDRISRHVAQLMRVGATRRRLHAAVSVGALFAAAADLAATELEFERAVIVSVEAGELRGDTSDALRNPASDRLRRTALAARIAVRPGSSEAELVRRARGSHGTGPVDSVLAEALELREYALAPIVVESRTLAILAADRAAPAIDALDTASLHAYAELVAASLEHVVLRARQRELAGEMQNVMASSQALMREMLEAPVTLPSSERQRESFPLAGPLSSDDSALSQRLSEGEARIAALLVRGRSNREIAAELILSPETVKATVARILRKLGAPNRVAAATMILQLAHGSAGEPGAAADAVRGASGLR